MQPILIITGDAGESYECLYARHRLLEAGLTPRLAAPSRRRLHLVIHDFEPGWDTYVERPGYGADADLTFDDVRVDEYGAVLVLGGRAPEYLRHDARVLDIVRAFDRAQKWVFAICHGVQILAAAGLVSARRVTAYENCRWEIEAARRHLRVRRAGRAGWAHRDRSDLAVASGVLPPGLCVPLALRSPEAASERLV